MSYDLGALLLPMTNCGCIIRETQKSKLFQQLETTFSEVENLPENCPKVFDGMVLFQKLPTTLNTFGEVSEYLLKKFLLPSLPTILTLKIERAWKEVVVWHQNLCESK